MEQTCPKCFAPKKGRCLNCKSNEYHRSSGRVVDAPCTACGVIRLLASNGECHKCLNVKGMAECGVCAEIKLRHLDFQERQAICRDCRHPKAHLSKSERARDAMYRRTYGIGIDEYHLMVEQQGGACAICLQKSERLAVDHDHTTGEVRGLLCVNCNIGLGNMRDSVEALENAIRYLSRSPEKPLTDQRETTHKKMFNRKVLEAENRWLTEQLQTAEERIEQLRPDHSYTEQLETAVRAYRQVLLGDINYARKTKEKAIAWIDDLLARKFVWKKPPPQVAERAS